jgi:hypothetical protein
LLCQLPVRAGRQVAVDGLDQAWHGLRIAAHPAVVLDDDADAMCGSVLDDAP